MSTRMMSISLRNVNKYYTNHENDKNKTNKSTSTTYHLACEWESQNIVIRNFFEKWIFQHNTPLFTQNLNDNFFNGILYQTWRKSLN